MTNPAQKLDVTGNININSGSAYMYNGTNALFELPSYVSWFFGNAGNTSLTGVFNMGFGDGALGSLTSGTENYALGINAMNKDTTGSANVAISINSLFTNVSGTGNTTIGYNSLKNDTAGFNSAIGYFTGYDVTTGDNNTFVGENTGRGVTTGRANTVIGAQVTGLAAGLANNIIIADGDGNQRINVNGSGNVGIGTTTPGALLSIQGSTGDILEVATSSGAMIGGYDSDGHRFSSGPAPAVSTCGTGSPTIVGDDNGGVVTTGTAATACTITFSKAFQKSPYCTFSDNSATIAVNITTISTSAVTVGLGAGLTGGLVHYSCSYHK